VDNSSANQQPQQNSLSEIDKMRMRLQQVQLPADLREKAETQIGRIQMALKYGGNLAQLDITSKYIDWVTRIPWGKRTQDMLDINAVKQSLDASHFGLEKLKMRILEYLSIIALQKKNLNAQTYHVQAPFFVGLAGTGKTTFAKAIAEALGRKFVRIPFGGLSSALDLRGQSKTSAESEPGMIIKMICEAGVQNPVILFDEMDRVAPAARAEVMGTLLEILDPGQNMHFTDYFIDHPFSLGEVLFVCTGNNTKDVSTAVLDRTEVIEMPNYTDEEKIAIGKSYVLPKLIKNAGLMPEQLTIDESLWPKFVRPLGFEPGVRSLERSLNEIVRKVAYKVVSGSVQKVYINDANVNDYTPSMYVQTG
jgi:ATP-dependent Lon protease